MASAKIETTLTLTDLASGILPVSTTKTITYTEKIDREINLATVTAETIWDPIPAGSASASEFVTDFDFLYIWADGNCDVEFTCNEGGTANVTQRLSVMRVAANIPFILAADDSTRSHGADDAFVPSATVDVIDKIRVYNPGTAAITVRFIIAT